MEVKISVIVPVYNVQNYLKDCLDSIKNQTYRNLEIICVEDCSTDSSREILRDIAKSDDRIQCIFNDENRGLSVSRNTGLEHATGKYVLFLDSDDFIDLDCIERVCEQAESMDADIIGFDVRHVDETGAIVEKEENNISSIQSLTGPEYFCKCVNEESFYVAVWTYIYSLQFLKRIRANFEPGMLHEDILFSFQTILKADKIGRMPITFYNYRTTGQSITNKTSNYVDRVKSMCIVVDRIQTAIQKTENQYLRDSMELFLRRQIFKTRKYYQQLEIVPEELMNTIEECRRVLPIIQGSLYNGYFPNKLRQDELDLIRQNKNVIVYGAGTVAKGLTELLIERGIHKYDIAVTEGDGNYKSISEYASIKEECVVIIASIKYCKEMSRYAKEVGFSHIIIPKY